MDQLFFLPQSIPVFYCVFSYMFMCCDRSKRDIDEIMKLKKAENASNLVSLYKCVSGLHLYSLSVFVFAVLVAYSDILH